MKILLLLLSLFLPFAAQAQSYPNRPVRVIIPWPPGQATDLAARLVGEKLSQQLGQNFIMENRPGAGGSIGTDAVAKAASDGYTLLASSSGPLSIMPNLQKTPYDPLKDLVPVSLTAKLNAVHVPYQGSAPAMTALIGGQINYSVETVASVVGHIKSGRLKVDGVTSATRTASLPDVPTLAEAADLPGFEAVAWIGYSAPAGTPREIVVRLSAEIQKAMQSTDMRERYVSLGLDQATSTPDEMAAFMRREQGRYAAIIKNAGIKIEN